MTPMVKWIDPTGRIDLAGSWASPDSLGVETSAAKRWSEDWSCGRDVGVTRGKRRKCVSWGLGFGGMAGVEGPWVGRGACGGRCGSRRGSGGFVILLVCLSFNLQRVFFNFLI